MEKFNRAERRAQSDRLKANRKFYWGNGRAYGTEGKSKMNPRQLGRVVQNAQMCSCPMCGNARKFYGRPLRETLDFISLSEQLIDL